MRASFATIALGGLVVTGGCTFSDGEPYGVVSASFDASYELRDDRDVGDGTWQKLVNEMEVRVDEARLTVEVVELVGAGSEIGSLTFDPANPPPGYSLCHNGHCHSDSGDLVDYEDIQAELAAGEGGTASTALVLQGGTDDLLDGAPLSLACGDCLLDRGRLSLVRLSASYLVVSGVIRDGLDEPRFDGSRSFEAAVSLSPNSEADGAVGVIEHAVSVPLDDENPSQVTLALNLTTSASLLDGIDPEMVAAASVETVAIDDVSTIRSAFSELELDVRVRRDDL
jgi:hypothetical protein